MKKLILLTLLAGCLTGCSGMTTIDDEENLFRDETGMPYQTEEIITQDTV